MSGGLFGPVSRRMISAIQPEPGKKICSRQLAQTGLSAEEQSIAESSNFPPADPGAAMAVRLRGGEVLTVLYRSVDFLSLYDCDFEAGRPI
jgi:hypothetical protein